MAKAVALLSGGLDSILACRLVLEQGIELFGLNFVSPFCTCTKKGCRHEAKRAADTLGIPLKVVPTGEDYIKMIKAPKHGYGRAMNPCIDCRIYTFTRARSYLEEIGAEFVVTGEVLGERPMSQHLQALHLIERESGLEGRVLRPLSARLLKPTLPETTGLVDRGKLLAIQGRSRKPQIALAREFGIKDYPCPAGGCLLTEKNFALRLKEAFAHNEDSLQDMKLLRVGRHFRLDSGRKVVVGRNETENKIILNLARAEDVLLEPVDVPGPVVLIRGGGDAADVEIAGRLGARYSDGKGAVMIKVRDRGTVFEVQPLDEVLVQRLRVG